MGKRRKWQTDTVVGLEPNVSKLSRSPCHVGHVGSRLVPYRLSWFPYPLRTLPDTPCQLSRSLLVGYKSCCLLMFSMLILVMMVLTSQSRMMDGGGRHATRCMSDFELSRLSHSFDKSQAVQAERTSLIPVADFLYQQTKAR